ncbi:hypothetical protein [uncultured Paracoccus sp.]|uniref:hypothetical protein n=1 Tax=uncultured Paracoccus sp. TaxID=189685 RepID=UPI002613015A|nr:hypothetical protein [uncultured Paracoccus sp.]
MRHAESAIVHVASVEVAVPADYAFDRLSDAAFVGGWSLGSMGLAQHDGEVFVGTSLFDRSQAFVEIHPVRKLGLIDYSVGSASHREPRIYIRITDARMLGWQDSQSIVALHAIRGGAATPERWARTCTAHETEILLIKAQLERAFGQAA